MRTVKNSAYIILVLFLGQMTFAEQSMQLDRKVVAFVDNAATDSVLLLSEDGHANWLSGMKIKSSQFYKILDADCVTQSQITTTMDSKSAGKTLAYPFLVGVGTACFIDEKAQSIRLLSNFKGSLPENTFSAVFAGQDENKSYFLINGKPWKTDGYLELVSIDKKTLQVSVRELITQVPGYSGAMAYSQGYVWVAAWVDGNDIYKISVAKIAELAQKGSEAAFVEVASRFFGGIEGMSLFLLGNDNSLLFDNEGYESFTVDKVSGTTAVVNPPCPPVAGNKQGWLILCGGTSLQNWPQ